MVVCFQKLKIRFALVVALVVCAAVLSSSASAQKTKPKENSNPKICTGGVINSEVTFEVKPIYPKAAKEARAEGQIPVMVRVDENGKVYEATACGGHKLLRQAAVDAAYQTQITPTIISGKAFKVGGILLYEFKLEEEKSGLVNTKRAQQIIGREGETATFFLFQIVYIFARVISIVPNSFDNFHRRDSRKAAVSRSVAACSRKISSFRLKMREAVEFES